MANSHTLSGLVVGLVAGGLGQLLSARHAQLPN